MKSVITLFFSLLVSFSPFSQNDTRWFVSIGFNAVDDDGKAFEDVFKVKSNWIFLPMPSSISVGKKINNSFSAEFSENLNSYNTGDRKDKSIVTTPILFMSMDVFGKYHINSLYDNPKWLDPFVFIGLGGTLRGKSFDPMPSLGFGVTFWFNDRLGLNLQSAAKFGVFSKNSSSYLQHTIDFRIRIGDN